MDMDLCGSALFAPEDAGLLLDCQSLLLDQSSDAGYHSACSSSLSPASSVDSCCFSPPATLFGGFGGVSETAECFGFLGSPTLPAGTEESRPAQRGRKSRSKYPGKKRQSASEREKLRMRDLTKALLHLRTYLPASVAPVGQTLTKIETLRLTIRYISHLSAQLGLSEEALARRSPSEKAPRPQASSPLLHSSSNQQPHACNPQLSPSAAQSLQVSPQQQQQLQAPHLHPHIQPHFQPHAYSPALETVTPHTSLQAGPLVDGFPMQYLPEQIHAAYQSPSDIPYAEDFGSVPQEFWVPPQQNMFYGLC